MVEEKQILDYFCLLKKRNCIGAAYLFVGENFSLVKEILKLIACQGDDWFCSRCWDCQRIDDENHPDLFIIRPKPSVIKIESIREGQHFLSLKSFRLKFKLLVIKEGEFSPEAASALLKTLEEPPKNSFIGICVSKTENIIPTILSRCRKVFLPFKEREETYLFNLVSQFVSGKQIKFKDRQDFSKFLKTLIDIYRDYIISRIDSNNKPLLNNENYEGIIKPYSVKKAIDLLQDLIKIHGVSHNINENLALNLIKTRMEAN